MSKKHFIDLANHIIGNRKLFATNTILSLADFLASQNPLFNRERWMDYIAGRCGPNGGAR